MKAGARKYVNGKGARVKKVCRHMFCRASDSPTTTPTLLSLAACQLCGSKFGAMQGDEGRGKRQEAQAEADAQAKAAVEAEAEANVKSNGRCKGGRDFRNTF